MKNFFVGLLMLIVIFLAALMLCGWIQTLGCFFAGVPQPHQDLPPLSIVVAASIPGILYASYAIGRYFELEKERKKAGTR